MSTGLDSVEGRMSERNFRSSSQSETQCQSTTSLPLNIPVARKEPREEEPWSYEAEVQNRHHALKGRKTILGPIPVKSFIDEFLPPAPPDEPMPNPVNIFDGVPSPASHEMVIREALATAINSGKWCRCVHFCAASDDTDEEPGNGAPKPDIVGYAEEKNEGFAHQVVGNLGNAEIFIEVQRDHDPFCDEHAHDSNEGESFISYENHERVVDEIGENIEPGWSERNNLGQITRHASELCSRQHRMFCFSILIVGTRARLLRWDRSGGIVTESFNYKVNPELLCEFLWRFGYANPVQRGFDPTVSCASEEEEELFRGLVKEHVRFQLDIGSEDTKELDEQLILHYEKGRVTKIRVYDVPSRLTKMYLVSVPVKSPEWMAGGETRGFWAVGMTAPQQGTVCFLKDTWHIDADGMESEGAVYDDLEAHSVAKICDLDAYGDVPILDVRWPVVSEGSESNEQQEVSPHNEPYNREEMAMGEPVVPDSGLRIRQRTRTNEFIDAPWVCECLRTDYLHERIRKRTHSRLVLKEAGFPLRTFRGSRELFEAARDTLEAIDSAYKKAKRLHRDVSIDNIVLYRRPGATRRTGLLVDWEFSTLVDHDGRAVDNTRVGTWAFMSLTALRGGEYFRHTLQDDMESLFYVVTYSCVRWLPHDMTYCLGSWIFGFFDQPHSPRIGRVRGGSVKAFHLLASRGEFLRTFQFQNECIQRWFRDGFDHLSDHHLFRGKLATWTVEYLRDLIETVCKGLSTTAVAETDRKEHELYDYYAAVEGERSLPPTSMAERTGNLRGPIRARCKEQLEGKKRTLKRKRSID